MRGVNFFLGLSTNEIIVLEFRKAVVGSMFVFSEVSSFTFLSVSVSSTGAFD